MRIGTRITCKDRVRAYDSYEYYDESGSLKSTLTFLNPGTSAEIKYVDSDGYVVDFISKISGTRRCFVSRNNAIRI